MAHNGTKMLIFGGGFGLTMSGTLYILDVPTMTWSQGPSSSPRMGMVCSVSGDYFIVWGGTSWDNLATPVPLSDAPILYNINLTRWTSTFVPKGKETPTTIIPTATGTTEPTAPSGTAEPGVANPVTGDETSSSTNHKAVIIGGSVGGGVLLILLVVCGVCFCRRRRRGPQQQNKEKQEEPTRKLQFRIVQQPATDATIEPTFYPTRPFRMTPPTTPKKSKQKHGERLEKESMNSPTHWRASHSQSDRTFTSPSTSTLVTSNIDTNFTAKILPQHIVTLDRLQAQRCH
ncbi:hypothetical protein BG015_005867 [Linnemannia schmuckeri]|uniref:Galactose oxidase n=1 Tax=Linnemannia schmuckeri TaxID=64567 RepID=A0A9P5S333_9FUNG|nr:hypothetical protein BG015_005867 [Linnemannia schmuckeri]